MADRRFKSFPVLKTERLILRQLENGDADEIFALRSSHNVNRYLKRKPCKSIDEAKIFIRTIHENSQRNDSMYWAIAWNDTGKLIGTICLYDFSDDNLNAEIGYELLPHFQGKGIMQEAMSKVLDFAFHHPALHSIEACTHSDNQSSVKLLEKFNFKKISDVEGNLMMFRLDFKQGKEQQQDHWKKTDSMAPKN